MNIQEAIGIDNQFKPFKFDTGGTYPLPKSGKLIQYTRYLHGNLITSSFEDIKQITYNPIRNGGQILFNNGAKDIFYKIWPIEILIR